jgi:hypothetical protein
MHNGSDNIHCESSHSAKWGVSVYSIIFFYQGWLFLQSLLLHFFIYLLIHTCMTKHFPSRISISISWLITTVSLCQRFFHLIRTTITTTTTGDNLTHKLDSHNRLSDCFTSMYCTEHLILRELRYFVMIGHVCVWVCVILLWDVVDKLLRCVCA